MRQPGFYLQPLPFSERDSRRSGTQKLLKRRCHIFVFHFAVLHGPAWPHGTPKTECQLLNRRHLKLETVGGRRFETCVLIRLPDTLRRTDSLEGRKAGKMCRKRSFSAFLPSKSALCQATGYAGNAQRALWKSSEGRVTQRRRGAKRRAFLCAFAFLRDSKVTSRSSDVHHFYDARSTFKRIGNLSARLYARHASSAASSSRIVAGVSSPIFERRNVFPFSFP